MGPLDGVLPAVAGNRADCATTFSSRRPATLVDLHQGSGLRPLPAHAFRHRRADLAGQARGGDAARVAASAHRPAARRGGNHLRRVVRALPATCCSTAGGFMAHLRFITGPGSERLPGLPANRGRTPGSCCVTTARLDRDLDGLAAIHRRRDRAWRCAIATPAPAAHGDLAAGADRRRTTSGSSTSSSTTTTASCCRCASCSRSSAGSPAIACWRAGAVAHSARRGARRRLRLYPALRGHRRRADDRRLALHGRALDAAGTSAARDLVAVSGLHEYLPRVEEYHTEEISTVAELRQEHPDYVVLNADYGTPFRRRRNGGR